MLLSHLYLERSHSLWKEDEEVGAWFGRVVKSVVDIVKNRSIASTADQSFIKRCETIWKTFFVRLPYSVYRHVYLADFGSSSSSQTASNMLQRYIPSALVSGPASLTPWGCPQMNAADPFPPTEIPSVEVISESKPVLAEYWTDGCKTCIDPYDAYYRQRLVTHFPHIVIPFLLPSETTIASTGIASEGQSLWNRLTSSLGISSSLAGPNVPSTHALRNRLDQLGLDSDTLPPELVDHLMDVMASQGSTQNITLPSIFSAFLQSMVPSWGLVGLSNFQGNSVGVGGVDILEVPGLIAFLQNTSSTEQ
jgi:hypothetical protein